MIWISAIEVGTGANTGIAAVRVRARFSPGIRNNKVGVSETVNGMLVVINDESCSNITLWY